MNFQNLQIVLDLFSKSSDTTVFTSLKIQFNSVDFWFRWQSRYTLFLPPPRATLEVKIDYRTIDLDNYIKTS